MKITITKNWNLELTEEERNAIFEAIGNTSKTDRKDINLATDKSDPLLDLYNTLEEC